MCGFLMHDSHAPTNTRTVHTRTHGSYTASRVRGAINSRDGGLDIDLIENGFVAGYVQCKQYESHKIGEPCIREFKGALLTVPAYNVAYFVTTTDFTKDARVAVYGKEASGWTSKQMWEALVQKKGYVWTCFYTICHCVVAKTMVSYMLLSLLSAPKGKGGTRRVCA